MDGGGWREEGGRETVDGGRWRGDGGGKKGEKERGKRAGKTSSLFMAIVISDFLHPNLE